MSGYSQGLIDGACNAYHVAKNNAASLKSHEIRKIAIDQKLDCNEYLRGWRESEEGYKKNIDN